MTDIDIPTLLTAQQNFATALEGAFRDAERFMALNDIAEGPAATEDERDALLEEAYEERYHCEVCVVRSVMERVWDPIEAYLDALERALGIAPEPTVTEAIRSLRVVE